MDEDDEPSAVESSDEDNPCSIVSAPEDLDEADEAAVRGVDDDPIWPEPPHLVQ